MNTLKIAKSKPKSAITAKKIALEVARELGMVDILLRGILDQSTIINKYAVQNICYFWDREPEQGFVILSNLMQEIKPVHHFTAINRSVRALRNGLNISAYIFL
ncbi:MAG: hypothetical protein HC875_27005 [Anaerolineales bacterium]|nr:hypothetical protein [Anaerolineales bacterium]